jgi:hypothetical protein
VIGPVTIEGLSWIVPISRPLVEALSREVPIELSAPSAAARFRRLAEELVELTRGRR